MGTSASGFTPPEAGVPSSLRDDDLAVIDLDQVHGRNALTAFFSFRPRFSELDLAIKAGDVELPQGCANCLRVGFSGLLDSRRDGPDTIIATEAFGHASELETALLPFRDEALGGFRIRRHLGHPWRERGEMHRAVDRGTGLIDQLIGILRAARGDDLLLQAERRRLFEHECALLDRAGHN